MRRGVGWKGRPFVGREPGSVNRCRQRGTAENRLLFWKAIGGGGGGGGGGVYLESYAREARFLTRWDRHAVALGRGVRRRSKEEEGEKEGGGVCRRVPFHSLQFSLAETVTKET